MNRVDRRLVELNLAPSRAKAQAMVRAGEVEIAGAGVWRQAKRPSEPAREVRVIAGGETLRFVSRGGLKLDHALNRINLPLADARVLDLGQSTGGFTDCALARGAAAVLGVDVGHGQLHPSLRDDSRVTVVEGVNVRQAPEHGQIRAWLTRGVSLVTADLSFISLGLIIPVLTELMPSGTPALLLVKPQFEAGAGRLNARGIVTDPGAWDDVRTEITRGLGANGFELLDYFPCGLAGADGNQEFFAYARRI